MKSFLKGTLLFLLALTAATAYAQPVRIAGSGANVGAISLMSAEFRKQFPATQFAPIEAVGSTGSIKAVLAGAMHIALTSRPLTDAERAAGAREIEYARTPFAIVVRHDSRIESITHTQIATYFSGAVDSGPDGVRVRPVLRPVTDVDNILLKRMSVGAGPAIELALKRPGMMVAATDREAADLIERTTGAIGATTLGLILAESRKLRALPLDGSAPTLAALESGSYPYYKRLFVVVADKLPANAEAQRFVDYITSAPGKTLLRRTGHLLPPLLRGIDGFATRSQATSVGCHTGSGHHWSFAACAILLPGISQRALGQ